MNPFVRVSIRDSVEKAMKATIDMDARRAAVIVNAMFMQNPISVADVGRIFMEELVTLLRNALSMRDTLMGEATRIDFSIKSIRDNIICDEQRGTKLEDNVMWAAKTMKAALADDKVSFKELCDDGAEKDTWALRMFAALVVSMEISKSTSAEYAETIRNLDLSSPDPEQDRLRAEARKVMDLFVGGEREYGMYTLIRAMGPTSEYQRRGPVIAREWARQAFTEIFPEIDVQGNEYQVYLTTKAHNDINSNVPSENIQWAQATFHKAMTNDPSYAAQFRGTAADIAQNMSVLVVMVANTIATERRS